MANIDALRVQKYSDSLEMLSQQKVAKLANFCRQETATGSKAFRFLSQIDTVNMGQRTNRAETIDNSAVTYDGRWAYWERFHYDTILDDIDLAHMQINPESQIVASAVAAANRTRDTRFATAFFGTAKTDETGSTSTVFDTNNVVAVTEGVGSATGLNIAKLLEARKILQNNDVDLEFETPLIAITANQEVELLAQTEATSLDFVSRPTLMDGKITEFLGFRFIVCSGGATSVIPTDSNSYRRLPVWVPSGMGCATWKPLSGDMRKLANYKGNPTLIEAEMEFGFTRLEEAKCVEIKCAE